MNLTPYVESVQESLAAASAAGDENAQRLATALGVALAPAVRVALMQALADLAAETTLALGDRVVELRLDGSDVRVSVTRDPEPSETLENDLMEAGALSRFTLRLPAELKAEAERAAAGRGVSLNTWLVRAVADALRRAPGDAQEGGHRIRGWVQA